MKHGKNPTKAQKQQISHYRLDPGEWLVSKDTGKDICLVHRYTNRVRWIARVRLEEPRKSKTANIYEYNGRMTYSICPGCNAASGRSEWCGSPAP